MSLPFDATLKDLAQYDPAAFLAGFDAQPAGPVALLNVDLSTVTAAADLVFGVGEPLREAIHIDCQSGPSPMLGSVVLVYNALLYHRLQVPVHSMVLLLRPRAQHPNVTGTIQYAARPGRGQTTFTYEVIRLWERPVEDLLAGMLPLAPLCRLPEGVELEAGLAAVVGRLIERVLAETPAPEGRRLLTAAFVLTGMRVDREIALELFQRVGAMRDSDTYQAILDEGRVEEAGKILLRQGNARFGVPDAATMAAMLGIRDLERLERMSDRLLHVNTWQALLETT